MSKPRQATEDRDKKIRYLASLDYSNEDIAKAVGLSPITVRDKRSLWGISRQQIANQLRRASILAYAAQGLSQAKIAKQMQTSRTTVRRELRAEKGEPVRNEKKAEKKLSSRIYVTDEEKSEIKQMYDRGASVREVIDYLGICLTTGYRYRRRWKNGEL